MTPVIRNALIKAATTQSYQQLDAATADALAEVERLYAGYADLLKRQVAQYSDGGYFVTYYLKSFLSYLNEHLALLKQQRDGLLNGSLGQAAHVGAQPAAIMGATNLSQTATAAVKATYDFQIATENLHLSERIWRIDRATREGVANAIRQAVAEGKNPMQAARELLQKGKGLPPELLEKIKGLQTGTLQEAIERTLLSGTGNPLYNMQRLFKTEMTRANAIAYVRSNEQVQGFKGFKFKLSPRHRREDICDRLARADDYGLGMGVYPADKILGIYPAHPNTTSYIVAVYD